MNTLRRAYTLVELLVSMSIFLVIMLFCITFFSLFTERVNAATVQAEQSADAAVLFAQVERDLQGAFTYAKADGSKVTAITLADSTLTFAARTRLNETGSGLGGLTVVQYGISGNKLLRRAEDVLAKTLSATDFDAAVTAVAGKNSDALCNGVDSCSWKVYTSRADFLAASNAKTAGTFYANPTRPPSGADSAYAIELTVKLKHPNAAVPEGEQDRYRRSFSKVFVLN